MIAEKSLVIFKSRPALVTGTGEKISVSVLDEKGGRSEYRVREKDLEFLHPGPADLQDFETEPEAGDAVRDAWELLSAQEGRFSFRELAELVYGAFTPRNAWGAWLLLKDGLYFTSGPRCRSAGELEAEEKRRQAKKQDNLEREGFLTRLRARRPELPGDARFFQDVEALALGRTAKSRTMKDLGRTETPEDAHRLLLETGFWSPFINPHPSRFGLSVSSPRIIPGPPPMEERQDLSGLPAFAIDSPWSDDPDDAISVHEDALYVHIADPASSIGPDSPAEKEARDRGATLYLPEGPVRMLAAEALPLFALGLPELSPALTFKIRLDNPGNILETLIFPSLVKVTRLSYQEADKLMDSGEKSLVRLRDIGERNFKRRLQKGAVHMDFPEVHISVKDRLVSVEPVGSFLSGQTVRECMLLAGEGAARWAIERSLPFPYVCQHPGDLPGEVLPGLAGSWQLRRCMRPRFLSSGPGAHWGLGLDAYTQVTSPLRRYTDLLAHLQIRTALRGESPLDAGELIRRLGAGDAAAQAVSQAERASRAHWLAVYLSDRKNSPWRGTVLGKKGNRGTVMIKDLALETQTALKEETRPNDEVTLVLKTVKIPETETVFINEPFSKPG
jgi:exoribonuclease-2